MSLTTLAAMTPDECTERLAQPIQDVGAAFYFDEHTIEYGKRRLGIDGFRFYFVGRGGVLGDVPAAVVRSAFGYFKPALLERMWNTGLERAQAEGARDVAEAYLECAYRFAEHRFDGIEVGAFNRAATAVIERADPAALVLFAGYRSMPVPEDPIALAQHNAILLRELRGGVHLAAVAAVGLDSAVAHAIRRPEELALFGLQDEPPEITDHDRYLLAEADRLTDSTVAVLLGTLDEDDRTALVTTADAMADRL